MFSQSSPQIQQQERQQRLLFALFGLALTIALVVFCFVGFHIVARSPREIDAGRVNEYVDNVPRRFAVEKLDVSTWAQRRMDVSDDIIFVMREQDGTWRALLGLDMRTGCFLSWDRDDQLFVAPSDPQCLDTRYTPDGRYLDGFEISEPPRPMAELRMEIRDGSVIVFDSLVLPE